MKEGSPLRRRRVGDEVFIFHFIHSDVNECVVAAAHNNSSSSVSTGAAGVSSGICEHKCRNYPGRFMCQCREGFRLAGDGRRCVEDSGESCVCRCASSNL